MASDFVGSLGPRLSRGAGQRHSLSPVVPLGGQPRLRSRREAGAGLLPGTASLVGSGPRRGMSHEPVLWCAALPETLTAIASRPQKTFGGGLSLAFFLGPPKPRRAICHLGPVTTTLWAVGFAWP